MPKIPRFLPTYSNSLTQNHRGYSIYAIELINNTAPKLQATRNFAVGITAGTG